MPGVPGTPRAPTSPTVFVTAPLRVLRGTSSAYLPRAPATHGKC
jgi:hypothetical protein